MSNLIITIEHVVLLVILSRPAKLKKMGNGDWLFQNYKAIFNLQTKINI